MKRGASQGSHCVWEGTPSAVQSDGAVNLHPGRARHVRLGSLVIDEPYVDFTERDRDECPSSEGRTQLLHRVYVPPWLRGWWSPQNHHVITVLLAASAATAEPKSGFELDLRYL